MNGKFFVEVTGDLFDKKDAQFLITIAQTVRESQNAAARKTHKKQVAKQPAAPAQVNVVIDGETKHVFKDNVIYEKEPA